ncbi:hypothetical protein EC396_03510 [Lutibacter sp. HS1-25]|uniref:hypothetical protein n=1 Tax=Lutibacter sp. HS1-25 TaxID=2485000 RepID=UPI00101185B6|nr:hypothetical protein [Lutibacter sp. HS1-25]RXP61886.1 hypothetical protein EC396_03510 [Lutibacter sp. HS1-25]
MKKMLIIMMLLIGAVSYSQEKTKEAVIVTSENKITFNNVTNNHIVAEAYKKAKPEQLKDLDKYIFTVYNPLSLFSDDKISAKSELLNK